MDENDTTEFGSWVRPKVTDSARGSVLICRIHGSLKVTPAMATGVIGGLWTIEDPYDAVMVDARTPQEPSARAAFYARMVR